MTRAAPLVSVLLGLAVALAAAQDKKAGLGPAAVDRARLFPAPNREVDLVGGRIAGSNTSPTDGFRVLGEIKTAPAKGGWVELRFENATPYRWVRYQAPPGSYGAVAEVEFYAGDRK